MYIIIAGLLVLVFVLIHKHTVRINELKLDLDSLRRQIKYFKDRLAEPGLQTDTEPSEADLHTEEIKTSADGSPEIIPPGPVPPPEETIPGSPHEAAPEYATPEITDEPPEKTKLLSGFTADGKKRKLSQGIDWENFLGAKLFAWVGGLSLFIGFLFLLKYSFDRNLISPAVRVALGFICGSGLVAGGMHLKRKTYEVTAQTLCATGIVILYASCFAANSIYQFFPIVLTVALMSLITAGAFILAVGMSARVIAILGMVGGFLTPPLLSTWQDQPFALFSYITFLNAGLLLVAFYRKWNFLAALGSACTVLTLFWWSVAYFVPEKVYTAMAVYMWFNALFCAALWYGKRISRSDRWLAGSAVMIPFLTFLFALFLIAVDSVGPRPGVIFTYILGADLCLLAVALLEKKLRKFQFIAGGSVFFILSVWIAARMTGSLLPWAMGASLVFALLHSTIPIMFARASRSAVKSWQVHLFPLLALVVTLIPIVKDADGWLIWPFVLLFNIGILALALLTASSLAILAAVVVTSIVIFGWLLVDPAGAHTAGGTIALIGAFGIFFTVAATYVLNRLRKNMSGTGGALPGGVSGAQDSTGADGLFFQIPVFSTVLPFMLLILASGRISIENPFPILSLGLLLAFIAFGLARLLKVTSLLPVAMGSCFLLEVAVHTQHFNHDNAAVYLGFYLLTTALFNIFPFLYRQDYLKAVVPWATAALSGPLHFPLIYNVIDEAYPNDIMGLLPAIMAFPFFLGLARLVEWIPKNNRNRNAVLAWFGGATLFFITLIFPIQFDHQWLTVSWALEGAALIWLYRKVPHPGLRGTGIVLLVTAFVRLAMNPALILYYPQTTFPIFNWYLYTYGIATICLMTGGRLMAPPRNRAFGFNFQPVLYALGTILAFLLMNIEIADLFSPGVAIKFQFTGDLARGMTYSLAWALFALCMLIAGIRKKLKPVRIAAICLIGITLVKLFFFDLNHLDQLYRIGAFVGVAIVLIAASALYQKWVVRRD